MDRTLEQEIHTMMLYLALEGMSKVFEVGFEAHVQDRNVANDLGQLMRDLREEVLDIAQDEILVRKVTKEDREKSKD